jgi:hypothetical protein
MATTERKHPIMTTQSNTWEATDLNQFSKQFGEYTVSFSPNDLGRGAFDTSRLEVWMHIGEMFDDNDSEYMNPTLIQFYVKIDPIVVFDNEGYEDDDATDIARCNLAQAMLDKWFATILEFFQEAPDYGVNYDFEFYVTNENFGVTPVTRVSHSRL